jgi:hypothetical protein
MTLAGICYPQATPVPSAIFIDTYCKVQFATTTLPALQIVMWIFSILLHVATALVN